MLGAAYRLPTIHAPFLQNADSKGRRRQPQTMVSSRGRVERTSLPAPVTRQVRPRLMATPRSESATMQCRKKTIPGSASTGFPENSIGQSIQFGLKVAPNEYPHAA